MDKDNVPKCLKCKYTNTNTQIQLRSRLQLCLACVIFLKRYWYKDFKDKVPSCLTCKYKYTTTQIHKYTNPVWVKVAVMPSMCYIFEKVMVQGPQK